MKLYLENTINKVFKKKLKLFFGEGARVRVSQFQYSTTTKQYFASVTLETELINESMEVFPDGLEIIVSDAYQLLALSEKLILTTSIEYKKNGTSNTTL